MELAECSAEVGKEHLLQTAWVRAPSVAWVWQAEPELCDHLCEGQWQLARGIRGRTVQGPHPHIDSGFQQLCQHLCLGMPLPKEQRLIYPEAQKTVVHGFFWQL